MSNKEASLLIRIKQAGGDALDSVAGGLSKIGEIAKASFAVVSAVVAKSVYDYGQQEKAVNSLNQSLVQQGIYSKDLSKEYQNMATAMQRKTTFADEEIVAAQATMQNYLGQTKITESLMKATLDLAAAKKIDLSSAAEMVGKSIGTETNALAKAGVKLQEGASESEKFAKVTETLTRQFGGQAEAAAKGYGQIQVMTNAIGELFEIIGENLQPAIMLVTQSVIDMTDTLQKNEGAMSSLTDVIKGGAKGVAALYTVFQALGAYLGGGLAVYLGAIGQILEGNFAQAFETVKTGMGDFVDGSVNMWKSMNDRFAAIDDAYSAAKKAKADEDTALEEQSAQNAVAIRGQQASVALEDMKIRKQEELEHFIAMETAKSDAHFMQEMRRLELEKKNGVSRMDRLKAELEQEKLLKAKMFDWDLLTAEKKMEIAQAVGNQAMELTNNLVKLTGGKNAELIALQKAMAIGMAIINTQAAITRGYMDLGPIGGAIFEGVAYANLGASIAVIAGVQLAEGGIVQARPGGTLATIGEGGRDEAVIPLEDGKIPGMGGGGLTVNLNVYGGLLGDEASAYELARALDRQLKRLQESGDSIAF